VKNDLSEREDVRGIIQRPIWSRFGIRRSSIAIGNKVQACLMAFNIVCTYIGTRDLVQEYITYKVWPLMNDWEMPKETAVGSSEGGLVYLMYTYHFRSEFDEPNDDWLEVVEATSDELLGAYTNVEDEAMTIAFGARDKRRMNRVFDVIRFFYPDYCFPARKQGLKRKVAASSSSTAPKSKKIKVLTHMPRPHPIKRTTVISDIKSIEIDEQSEPLASEVIPATAVEASIGPAEETEMKGSQAEEHSRLLSPPPAIELPKLTTAASTSMTPKKRRMTSILDVVLKSMKVPTPATAEASVEKIEDIREAVAANASSIHTEA
jgi:hypothetical protein